ncbi:MAG: rhamnan synthesis F family protein [Massilibacteroides sp.]|nr:rhamnan synthesis F family protein [Massilibacteroides sp.]MDD3062044.1 rhamnan synthesis F family protein [Massilibacteroides sp.]MDD4116116.1 rhamnan synthesis F family protein [Massilibacteroides sp.]MDD4661503.1 rhamnan synthesis F family protein [Massilibacteroides sp.]
MKANSKQSICAFIHYSQGNKIPYNVEVYIKELVRFFDVVRLITNRRSIENQHVLPSCVQVQFEKNEGYDFGLFNKFFNSINRTKYHTIACINDSNVLINKLDPVFQWGKNQTADFWGIIDSNERPWFSTHKENYHLQSHFLIFRNTAIAKLENYFNWLDMDSILEIEDVKKLRRKIINDWEIGLSCYFKQEGISINSYCKSSEFNHRHHKKTDVNTMHKLPKELVRANFPIVKKKILQKELKHWLGGVRARCWTNLVVQHGNNEWNLNEILKEIKQ